MDAQRLSIFRWIPKIPLHFTHEERRLKKPEGSAATDYNRGRRERVKERRRERGKERERESEPLRVAAITAAQREAQQHGARQATKKCNGSPPASPTVGV
jgi:hypothetical protein